MRPLYSTTTRVFLLWLLLLSTASATEQGLLWHISGKGADSYLFGTMHSEDPRITTLPEVVARHFDAADTLMLEVSLDDKTQMAVAAAMMLPPGSLLSSVVGEELAREAQQAMLERGIPPEVTERMQPWATVVTLSMPQMQTGLVLDQLLYQRAQLSGKRFVPLESAEDQLSVFSGLSHDEQRALLRHVLNEYMAYPEMFEQLTEAYLKRDLAAIVRMGEENPMSGDPGLQQKMMERLIDVRNRQMVERMVPQLQGRKVFVAVGALHLPGETGLISLLRKQGYRLSPLY